MSHKSVKTALALAVLVALTAAAPGLYGQKLDRNVLQSIHYREIGPTRQSGRFVDFAWCALQPKTFYAATASGHLWKTVNNGISFTPLFTHEQIFSIGDVAVAPSNPDIIWVGTGEECPRNSIAWGDGIYKSVDGGKSFTHMGLKSTQSIGRIIPHPTDPDIVYVAAAGPTWGYSGDRGLFKTTDGGKSWLKLAGGLPDDGRTGAIDLVIHPDNPDVLYVSFWQRIRRPWRFDSGGPNGGIFKTTDAGSTWTRLTAGIPEGDLGRIGLAISRSNPEVLAAVIEHGFQPQPTIREGQTQKPNPDYDDMS